MTEHTPSDPRPESDLVPALGRIGRAVEGLPPAVFLVDAGDRFVYVNRAAEALVGCARGDIVGKTVADALGSGGLGERLEVHDVLFKYHAACHGVHATIEAVRAIQAKAQIAPANIERVEVAVQNAYMDICGIPTPETGLEGKFSLRFCTALALAGQDTARTDTYSDENVKDPALVALFEKTTIVPKRDMKMKMADVTVHTRDGVVHREIGDVGIPATDLPQQWQKLVAKFKGCAEPVVGKDKAAEIIEAVRTLDLADDVSRLMQACG